MALTEVDGNTTLLVERDGTGGHRIANVSTSTSIYIDIAKGNVAGSTAVNKFGRNITVGATSEEIWDYSSAYEYLADDTFATMYISSDAAGDTGLVYNVQGVDDEYNVFNVTVTTDASDGRTFVAIDTGSTGGDAWRIFRAKNTSGTAAAGNIYISKDNTDTGPDGIPDTVADIQAQIKIGAEQTLMALWTVPVGKTAYMTSYYAATSSDKVTAIKLYYRPFGGVFNIKHALDIAKGDTIHPFDFPLVFAAKGDIKLMAAATGGGGIIDGGFDLWYE